MPEVAAIRALLALIATIVSIPLAAPVILFALPFWTVSLLTRAMSRWLEPRFVPCMP